MSLIFFDLETSDKEPCGQILNYSFIRTNNNFEFEDELSGEISISVLQIPAPMALLTNRIRVLDHQAACKVTEPEACQAISNFISESIFNSKDQVFLVGYNSTRFDIPYLRTTFIRNGINPYFSGKIKYQDVLFLVRKAFLSKPEFVIPFKQSEANKLSLSLEAVSTTLGLLDAQQTHNSRDDVLLTIKLCRYLDRHFQINPARFSAYEADCPELIANSPNYEMNLQESSGFDDRRIIRPMALLAENYRSALWIDINRYQQGEGRAAISWYNKTNHQLIKSDHKFSPELSEVCKQARAEFKQITPENFFPRSSCDIEQDIYRLDINRISDLALFIKGERRGDLTKEKDVDFKELATRYLLAYGISESRRGSKWKERFHSYINYRYAGGQFQLTKTIPESVAEDLQIYHPSLSSITEELNQLREKRNAPEDLEILDQLKDFIQESLVSSYL